MCRFVAYLGKPIIVDELLLKPTNSLVHQSYRAGVPRFPLIKRKLLSLLNDELFLWIQGQTDSEHIFALLMQHMVDMMFQCVDGVSTMVRGDSGVAAVLIVSEKLSDHVEDWIPIPRNHFIAVDKGLEVHQSPMKH